MKQLTVKAVIGSWKAYNECSARSLGSQELDLSKFSSVNEITEELKKEGFTSEELEETFVQDIEISDPDVCLFTNAESTSYISLFDAFQKELAKMAKCDDCEGYTISINKYKAVNVQFKSKPSTEVLQALKAAGFRWFKPTKSWSAFKGIDEVKELLTSICGNCPIVNIQEQRTEEKYQLKGFKLIEDYQEKYDILDKYYLGGMASWNNTPDNIKYRDKHIIGATIILKTKDDYLITIDSNKPKIDNTLYYDDELEGPKKDYINFEEYNINLNLNNQILISAKHLFKNKNNDKAYISSNWQHHELNDYIRELTEEEKEDLNYIYQILEADYKKRLANYWKKYESKVTTHGYWRDR